MRKIQALFLSILLFGNCFTFHPIHADEYKKEEMLPSVKAQYENDFSQQSGIASIENEFEKDQNQNVRIIVELEGEPIIARAIEEGISYFELNDEIIEEESERIQQEQQYAMDDLIQSDLEIELKEDFPTFEANFNGFVLSATPKEVEKIKQKPYVKNVYISQEFERPQLKSSHDLIGSSYAWNDLHYKGEGMVIAIIDTGVDPSHEAMRLDDDTIPKHDENSINTIIHEHNLKGRYLSSKIPYGYNYYDHNHNILDSYGSMHGIHVAGIAAANSQKTGVKGVSPNAQILALKVFSDDVQYPTTFTDVWIKAIDDAIKLKADVINMSLGSPAGLLSVGDYNPEEEMIERAKKAGIIISISAGNDGNIMRGNPHSDKVNLENPDSALIASPSLYKSSLSVASVENNLKYDTFMNFTTHQQQNRKFRINIVKGVGKDEIIRANPVDLGNAQVEDFEKHGDLSGKIIMFRVEDKLEASDLNTHSDAEEMKLSTGNEEQMDSQEASAEEENLQKTNSDDENSQETSLQQQSSDDEISQETSLPKESTQEIGAEEISADEQNPEDIQESPQHEHDHGEEKLTLLQKLELAKEKNPSAVILYNTERLGENLGISLTHAFPYSHHTIALIGYEAANTIHSELKINPDLEITLSSELVGEINTQSGKISKFSSWGPTSDLKIKPEIAAPGGNIYSTVEGDDYRSMSGTSMASPHVAGASALLKQRFLKEGISYEEIPDKIKLTLMNTANPVYYDQYNLAFVRQQGAGLMQLDKALKTQVSVKATGESDGEQDGKLELGELKNKSFQYRLELENTSKERKIYKPEIHLINDIIMDLKLLHEPESNRYLNPKPNTITLEPYESKILNMEVDFSIYDGFEMNQFVEGFILLKDMSTQGDKIDLSVPFLGFYGDWSKPNAIDAFEIPEHNSSQKRRAQFVMNKNNHAPSSSFSAPNGLSAPIIDNMIYFSPDAVKYIPRNYFPKIGLRLAPLRNMDSLEYSILDANSGETLKVIGKSYNIRKLNRLGSKPNFVFMPDSLWDGTIGTREVKDGDHFIYQLKAKLNTGNDAKDIEQIYQYKIAIDIDKPEILENGAISSQNLDANNRKISFKVRDISSGLKSIYLQSVYFVTKESDKKNVKDTIVGSDIVGENPDLTKFSPRYQNFIKIQFVGPNTADSSQKILKVTDGVLHITKSDFDSTQKNQTLLCDLNHHDKEEISVSIEFPAEHEYMSLTVVDKLDHMNEQFKKVDGYKSGYAIHFFDYHSNLEPNRASLSINGVPLSDSEYRASGTSRVKIEFKEKNYKFNMLKISTEQGEEFLVKNSKINETIRQKYNIDADEFKIEFDLDEDNSEYMIFTKLEEVISEEMSAELSFEGIDFSKFKTQNIRVITDPYLGVFKTIDAQHPKLKHKKGQIDIVAQLENSAKVDMIRLKSESQNKFILPASDLEEYAKKDNIYIIHNHHLYIKLNLIQDSKLGIVFEEEDSLLNHAGHSSENREAQNGKYPIIVLKKPALLEVKTERDLKDSKLEIEGFVGYIKDDLKSLTYHFVDEFGNKISEDFEIPSSQIKKEEIHFHQQNKLLYHATGYSFYDWIKPQSFHTNLKIEAISSNGEKASIVRRLFFDNQFAKLSYEVAGRKLSDSNAVIKIKASDNSFKINLYNNNSLAADVNLSLKSFESKDAKLEKEITVPLKMGQNKIEIKAVDLSLHESKKTIYIYRTK